LVVLWAIAWYGFSISWASTRPNSKAIGGETTGKRQMSVAIIKIAFRSWMLSVKLRSILTSVLIMILYFDSTKVALIRTA
jgi:hypothetical protein